MSRTELLSKLYNHKYKMEETHCIVDKRKHPCVEPKGYQREKRNRLQFYRTCAICGTKKVRKRTSCNRKENWKKKKKPREILILLLVQQLMLLFTMAFLGWQKRLLKWEDMEEVN